MPNQIDSSDIKALLRIIGTHQKGVGGGGNAPSAQLAKPTAPNAFLEWIKGAAQKASSGISTGVEALDKALGMQPLTSFPNSPTLGDAAAILNKGMSGNNEAPVTPGDKSLLPLLPMLGMALLGEAKPGKVNPAKVQEGVATGGKTAEEIQAMKAAGIAPKINTAQNVAAESSGILNARGNPIPSTQKQYATEKPTSPLNVAAENTGQGKAQPKTPYTPHPDIPNEPMPVTDRTGVHPVTGGNPVQVDLSAEAKRNSYYLSDQTKSQSVLDKYVSGNNAQEVEKNLPLQLQEESKRIQNIIGQKPQSVNTSDIITENASNMAKKGFTPGNNVKADEATTGLQKELYSQLTAGKSNIVPPNMTGEDLRSQISIMDSRLQSVYKKMDNNTVLTPEDTAALTYRQTLSNKLKSMYPPAGAALDRQSAMIDAIPSVAKASQVEKAAAYTKATAPQPDNPFMSFLKGSVSSPSHVMATAGALAAGGLGLYAFNESRSVPKDYKFSSGNVTLPALDQIKDTNGSPLGVNIADYTNGIRSINDQEKAIAFDVTLGIPSAVAKRDQLELQRNSLETKYKETKPVYDQYVETSNQMQGLNQVHDLLKNANPAWFQAFGAIGSQFTGIRAAIVPGYAQFEQSLNNLHQQFGIDVSSIKYAASPEAADAAINQTVKSYQSKLENTIKNAGGVMPEKQSTGKDILDASVNAVHKSLTGNSTLDSILTPTPTQTPTPQTSSTPNAFQQLMNQPFQPGQL